MISTIAFAVSFLAWAGGPGRGEGGQSNLPPASGIQAPAVQVVYSTGLAGYWKLDEGTGTTTADSSGNGQTGTLSGSPTWITTGLPPISFADPAALSFSGSGDYVYGPGTFLPTGTSAMTVLAWIRTTSTFRETPFSYGSSAVGQTVSLDVSQVAANGHFYVDFYGEYLDSGVAVNDGHWHHVGFTLAGGTTAITMYVDGVAYPATLGSVPNVGAGTNFQIGRWVTAGGGDTNPYWFDGSVDDVRVYSRVLSAAEVAVLAAGKELDLSFRDHYGRSTLCVNSATGAWQYAVLKGNGTGKTYSGTGTIVNGSGYLRLTAAPGTGYGLTLIYYTTAHRATATFTYRPDAVSSALYDANTLDDPATCGQTPPPLG